MLLSPTKHDAESMRSVLKAQGFSLDVPELKRAAVLNAVKVKGAAAGPAATRLTL